MRKVELALCAFNFLYRLCRAHKAHFTLGICQRFAFAGLLIFAAPAISATPDETADALPFRRNSAADMPVANDVSPAYFIAMRPERDIEAILLDTFNEAVRSGSAGALIKFISRNPEHPLADKARQLLKDGDYPPARRTPSEWVDSKIVEFDAARRDGTSALKEFIAKHPGHPLAAEARRLLSE